MSELINAVNENVGFRRKLLSTVSSAALLVSVIAMSEALASDENHPTVWIELGGQLERQSGLGDPFEAPFMLLSPTPNPYIKGSPIEAQRPSRYSVGGEGKLTLEPQGSDWVFSAEVRYGRSENNKRVDQQTNYGRTKYLSGNTGHPSPFVYKFQPQAAFADTTVKQSQSHMVLDFMAGKDVGLGMFGHGSTSVISAGVRYAQFSSSSHVTARAQPHVTVYNVLTSVIQAYYPKAFLPGSRYRQYSAFAIASRSFHGIGPALSWSASIPMIGNERAGELTFDWGLNGAVLFGRQKAVTSHHSTTYFHTVPYHQSTVAHPAAHSSRSRSIVVPNAGLTAAVSYRVENFKATLGYRGDFFFGAVDGGIDERHTQNLGFHGPFASIGIGLP